MSHVTKGDRVYLVDSDAYGDVERTTFLGKPGAVLYNDDGTLEGYTEKDTKSNIVAKSTGKNGLGVVIETPLDVRVEGVSILDAMNIDPADQKLMFAKFMGMFSKSERRAYVTDWNAKKDDPVQRTLFLNNIVEDLDDDEVFIATEGTKALIEVEPEVQKTMFAKFLSTTDKKSREALILEWLMSKNDKDKKDAFLQKMYEVLMEDDDYIKMEGRKSLSSLNIGHSDQVDIFEKFLQTTSPEERRNYRAEWVRVRRSPSQRDFFLKNFLGLINTGDDTN